MDSPIRKGDEDALGYKTYAELLSKKILNSHFENAYAIGINGKWGLGKTSFINLLKKELNGDLISIDFNSWSSQTPQAIITNFFSLFQEKLSSYHSSLHKKVSQYSDRLVKLNDTTFTRSIQSLAKDLFGDSSLEQLYKDINGILKKINKKIVVYIDDMDRLDAEEIIEIIRLIRNTANFYNTYFIVAYDRNYVIQALKKHNLYNPHHFLEKIYQLEITLPYFESSALRYKLVEILSPKFPDDYRDGLTTCIVGSETSAAVNINGWLETMRDVTRLANALSLNLIPLLGNVELNDFVKLELLRIKFPAVHELLFKYPGQFLSISNKNRKSVYELARDKEDPDGQNILKKYLKTHSDSLSTSEIEKIIALLENIFPTKPNYSFLSSGNNLSIIYPSKFYRYFAYTLLQDDLSEIEFGNARTGEKNQFFEEIDRWIEIGLEAELKDRFYDISDFDDEEDCEKVIIAIFYFAGKMPKKHIFNTYFIGYDSKDLKDKLNKHALLHEKSNEGVIQREGTRHLLLSILNNTPSPYLFSAYFLQFFDEQYGHSDFILDIHENREIRIKYFAQYCKEASKVDTILFQLFWATRQTEFKDLSNNEVSITKMYPEVAKQHFRKFIEEKDLDGYLIRMIEGNPFGRRKYSVSKAVLDIFDNWTEFKVFLFKQKEDKWKNLKEFKEFFTKFEENNYAEGISFKFDKIQISLQK